MRVVITITFIVIAIALGFLGIYILTEISESFGSIIKKLILNPSEFKERHILKQRIVVVIVGLAMIIVALLIFALSLAINI